MTIKITGLNEEQRRILDIMWNLPTLDDLQRWRNNLPKREKLLSITLEELLKAEYIDTYISTDHDIDVAKEILENIRGKSKNA